MLRSTEDIASSVYAPLPAQQPGNAGPGPIVFPLWGRATLLLILAAVAFYVLRALGPIVQIVTISALLAYLFDPLVRRLERRGLHRRTATGIIFLVLLVVLGVLLFAFIPVLLEQLRSLQTRINLAHANERLQAFELRLNIELAALGIATIDLTGALQQFIDEQVGDVLGYVPGLLALLGNIVLVPLVMFFLLKDGRAFKKGFISTVPNRYLEPTINVLHQMDSQLGAYLRGKLILSLFVGLLSILALWLLGVDYYVVLGALNGLANLIPYLGPLLGGIATVLVAVFTTGSFDALPGIVVAYSIIQVIDNAVFQPLVLARNVHLHPLTIILVIIVGGQFFGVLGLFLAVPAAGVVKVVVQEVLHNLRQFHLA